jgi:hypothetical protein
VFVTKAAAAEVQVVELGRYNAGEAALLLMQSDFGNERGLVMKWRAKSTAKTK